MIEDINSISFFCPNLIKYICAKETVCICNVWSLILPPKIFVWSLLFLPTSEETIYICVGLRVCQHLMVQYFCQLPFHITFTWLGVDLKKMMLTIWWSWKGQQTDCNIFKGGGFRRPQHQPVADEDHEARRFLIDLSSPSLWWLCWSSPIWWRSLSSLWWSPLSTWSFSGPFASSGSAGYTPAVKERRWSRGRRWTQDNIKGELQSLEQVVNSEWKLRSSDCFGGGLRTPPGRSRRFFF